MRRTKKKQKVEPVNGSTLLSLIHEYYDRNNQASEERKSQIQDIVSSTVISGCKNMAKAAPLFFAKRYDVWREDLIPDCLSCVEISGPDLIAKVSHWNAALGLLHVHMKVAARWADGDFAEEIAEDRKLQRMRSEEEISVCERNIKELRDRIDALKKKMGKADRCQTPLTR